MKKGTLATELKNAMLRNLKAELALIKIAATNNNGKWLNDEEHAKFVEKSSALKSEIDRITKISANDLLSTEIEDYRNNTEVLIAQLQQTEEERVAKTPQQLRAHFRPNPNSRILRRADIQDKREDLLKSDDEIARILIDQQAVKLNKIVDGIVLFSDNFLAEEFSESGDGE